MFLWPGVVVACASLTALVDGELVKVGKTVYKYKSFLWDMYQVKKKVPTLNQTFLMMVKSLKNVPYELDESPWKTYSDVRQTFSDVWPYLIRIDETTEDFNQVSKSDGTEPRTSLNMSSYSYLGAVKEKTIRDFVFQETIKGNYAFGNHGPRMLGGNNKWLCRLEESLADFTGREAALCCSSGFLAGKSSIQAVTGPKDMIFADTPIHESWRDGVRSAQAKGCKRFYFRHNDFEHLEELLDKHRESGQEAFIIIESVYSMDGDLADLPVCQELANKFEAKIILDEAHGLGILGKTGRGLEELQNCPQAAWLIVGSMTKALSSVGGYVCGDAQIVDFLHFFATGTMFSAPMSVPAALAAYATLRELQCHPEWLEETRSNMAYLHEQLKPLEQKYGVIAQTHEGAPLIAFIMKDFDSIRVLHIATALRHRGFYVAPVQAPACPMREPRLRLTAPRGITPVQIKSFVVELDRVCLESQDMHDPMTRELSGILSYLGF
jgi:7-keto-8-aminopelargonate synthetase-like enzyme